MAVAKIAAGQQEILELGDIEVARDWGWAPDYVHGMRLMLGHAIPKDFVLATGISHRLSYFVAKAFESAGIINWRDRVVSTADNQRKIDTNLLVGDSQLAYTELGWRHTVDFDSMAAAMVAFDQELLANPQALWTNFHRSTVLREVAMEISTFYRIRSLTGDGGVTEHANCYHGVCTHVGCDTCRSGDYFSRQPQPVYAVARNWFTGAFPFHSV
jgi:hypothetical protein